MKTKLKTMGFAVFFLLAVPLVASAHALPVGSTPSTGAVVDQAPPAVTIQFSENVDPAASDITVTGPSGATVSTANAKTAPNDAHFFSVPIKSDGNGTYIVKWSAVSADDGHFTSGAFPFAVGKGETVQQSSVSDDVEIVELTTTPEALGSAVELAGHGILWAVLLLFIFGIRPLANSGKYEDEMTVVRRWYGYLLSFGALLAFGGGVAQLIVKTVQLEGLRSIGIERAFDIYVLTDAGIATVVRMAAVVVIMGIFLFGRKAILFAKKVTWYEIAIFLALCCFAYYRAKISHATSNPFHPGFSILVNFFHVIEKDVWEGIVLVLFLLSLSPRMRRSLIALIPRSFQMLAIDFAFVSVTATYIVWLHLKTFANLFSTDWGAAFLELLLVAVLLVGMRIYHVLARLYRPGLFAKLLPMTLATELAFAILVVYCSSVVIITSPPLEQAPTKVFTAVDQGMTITLGVDPYEDGMMLLTENPGQKALEPVLTVQNASDTQPISMALAERYPGGYVFPQTFLTGPWPYQVVVTAPQPGAYDAHATFTVQQSDLVPPPGWEAQRPLDTFTIVMILIALAALAFAYPLWKFSGMTAESPAPRRNGFTVLSASAILLAALFLGAGAIEALHGSYLEDPFAYECNADGNEWHVMLPSMAGVPTSQTPAQGCMWGMGNYMYMFPNQAEYDYYKDLGPANVTMATAPQQIVAGQPTTITVSLKNQDGSPATLFVDMDKLLHVIIISKDETVFAHIHPDDLHPLTQQEIDTSTFTVTYTFPKSGEYLIAFDYSHGVTLESKQFEVQVAGGPPQSDTVKEYPSTGTFDGYDVSLRYALPIAGQIETVYYTIEKNGKPVTLVPYLSAAMHVVVVKNDFSWYLHAHGEVHPPGTPLPPIIVKNGQVLHSMAMMVVPDVIDTGVDPVEAHFIFPTPGIYTVWGQFLTQSGDLVPTAFTVQVEQ